MDNRESRLFDCVDLKKYLKYLESCWKQESQINLWKKLHSGIPSLKGLELCSIETARTQLLLNFSTKFEINGAPIPCINFGVHVSGSSLTQIYSHF